MGRDDRFEIRQALVADWQASKAIRLRALADAPNAFLSTLEREQEFEDAVWRSRLESSHQLIAWLRDEPVGTVTGLPRGEMVAMWVAPEHRRAGLGARLVAILLEWARARGLPELRTWVADGNEAALRLYERMGFALTGEVAPMRDGLIERLLIRAL